MKSERAIESESQYYVSFCKIISRKQQWSLHPNQVKNYAETFNKNMYTVLLGNQHVLLYSLEVLLVTRTSNYSKWNKASIVDLSDKILVILSTSTTIRWNRILHKERYRYDFCTKLIKAVGNSVMFSFILIETRIVYKVIRQ